MKFPSFNLLGHSYGSGGNSHLRCPYKGCEKDFEKPSLLTDKSVVPSESYYACPHCNSKIEIVTEKLKIVEIKTVGYPSIVLYSPAKCAHFNGLLGSANVGKPSCAGGNLPDECLVCPKVLQCETRRHRY